MDKSPEAFRTISEVADWLGVPTHVLRFWESRFPQVRPVKRAGGRRYYRPADMTLLGGIKRLLHDDGMTIRGVQKLLREEGVRHVAAYSQPIDAPAPLRDMPVVGDGLPAAETPAPARQETPSAPAVAAMRPVPEAPPEPLHEALPEPEPLPEAESEAEVEPAARAAETRRPLAPPAAAPPADGPPADGPPADGPAAENPPADRPAPPRAVPEPPVITPPPVAASAPTPPAQPDLFAAVEPPSPPEAPPERPRAAPPTPSPMPPYPRPRTVDVPPDPADDDPARPARAGLAARLRGGATLRGDRAEIAAVAAALRDLRARV